MNKLPLIVKPENVPAYCNASNVIREVFRDDLETDLDYSQRSKKEFEEYYGRCEELRAVERELMTNEAVHLLQRNNIAIKYDELQKEQFSPHLLQKYCIIRNSEILPTLPLGFVHKMRQNSECQIISEKKSVLPGVKVRKHERIECGAPKIGTRYRLPKTIVEKSKLPVMLVAEPSKVLFLAYKVGNIYKRHTKLQNIGSSGCHFDIDLPVTGSPFLIEWEPLPGRTKLIAPGQSIILKVSFHCKGLYNIDEKIVVHVDRGKDVAISLVACRPDPFLIAYVEKKYIQSYLDFSHLDSVLAHTLECGNILLGTISTINHTLLNIGPDARFYIMIEESWSSLCINNFKEDNTLCIEEFSIFPVYFSVRQNQLIDISVTVTASHTGLYLAHALVLCDNCTLEYLDILAEAFSFKTDWIHFKDMEKSFDIDIEDNMEAEWYIDLGVHLRTSNISHTFTLHNIGGIHFNYHWEIIEANIPGTNELSKDLIEITEASGLLFAKRQHMTSIHCNMTSASPGKYRTILVLVIDHLPRKCIEIKDSQLIMYESEESVSLKLGMIEVWLELVKPCVIVNPFLLDLSTGFLQCGKMEFMDFEIINNSPGCVNISLHLPNSCPEVILYCEPEVFDVEKLSTDSFVLIIEPKSIGFFTQVIKCIVNDGELVLDLLIKGNCSSGYLTSSKSCLDFGIVKKSDYPSQEISIKSCYDHKVLWEMQELEYTKENKLKLFDCVELCSINAGYFCHKGSYIHGEYLLDNTNKTGIHCSLLEWSVGNDSLYTQVIADVFTTDVSLEFISYTFDKLYLNVKASLKVTARNHTLLPTTVYWGHHIGDQHSLLVQVSPKNVLIQPAGEETFEIFVTPVIEGLLEDFYLPCFVELQGYPLVLQIKGKVEGLQVVIQWQAKEEHIRVVWPPIQSSERILPITNACSLSWKDLSEEFMEESYHSLKENDAADEVEVKTSLLGDEVSVASSEPYVNWPIIGGKYTRSKMEDSDLERDFNEPWGIEYPNQDVDDTVDSQINDPDNPQALTFLDVPTKQLVTQNVYLFNETEMECCFTCLSEHYDKVTPQPSSESLITTIQKKVYEYPESDEYFLATDKDKSLSITVDPSNGFIPTQGTVILKVTAYALAWGEYRDAIQIYVGNLPVFSLAVNVFCNEYPVCILQPSLRFGSFSYLDSKDKSETLWVKNNSCLPIYISWQMFVDFQLNNSPFSIILVDDFTSNLPFHLHLVPNIGVYCNEIFKMKDLHTIVKPWTTEALEIKFNPRNELVKEVFNNEFTKYRGNIVGHVFATPEINQSSRKVGFDLQPLEASVEASVQVPMLKALNLEGFYIIFKCKAWEVMQKKYKVLNMEKVIILGNNSQVLLQATVSVSMPFYIHSLYYQKRHIKCEAFEKIILSPKETCEMKVICEVTEELLEEFFTEITEKEQDTIEAAHVMFGKITFKQPAIIQEMNLELRVYLPILIVTPTNLDFGPVYINRTKHELLYIKSVSGTEKISLQFQSNVDSVFSFDQKSDIEKLELIDNNFVVTISFAPRDSECYNSTLLIKTCLSSVTKSIPLSGIGTWNYRDYC